jgi:hypothetical protein
MTCASAGAPGYYENSCCAVSHERTVAPRVPSVTTGPHELSPTGHFPHAEEFTATFPDLGGSRGIPRHLGGIVVSR